VARERTNKQLNSHEVPEPRIKPTTHWDHSRERRAYYRNATHANQQLYTQYTLFDIAIAILTHVMPIGQ
jgi:hypothetical protein